MTVLEREEMTKKYSTLPLTDVGNPGRIDWTCPALVESVYLTSRAFRSKAMGLWKPSDECRLTGL